MTDSRFRASHPCPEPYCDGHLESGGEWSAICDRCSWVEAEDAIGFDGGDPVQLVGDVDSDADLHAPSRRLIELADPARAVVALQSGDPQNLISGRGALAAPGICLLNHLGQPA